MIKLGQNLELKSLPDCRFKNIVKFYRAFIGNNDNFVEFNGLPIYLNKSFKKIGINLSAGTDSTLLLYILSTIIRELKYDIKIYPISVVRFWEDKQWSEQAKENVYKYLKNLFPEIIEDQQWGFIPTAFEMTPLNKISLSKDELNFYESFIDTANSDIYYFISYNRYLTKKLSLNAIYGGTTTNPIDIKMPEAPAFRDKENVNFMSIKNHINFLKNYDVNLNNYLPINPFIDIEKNWIMAQYDNLNLKDLQKMTRSCVEMDIADEGCGRLNCFHCSERKWANDNKGIFLNLIK